MSCGLMRPRYTYFNQSLHEPGWGRARDLDGRAGRAGRAAAEPVVTLVSSSSERLWNCCVRNLKMVKRKKRQGGAEKQRFKKLKFLEVEASKCAKLTDHFGAGTTNLPAATGAAAPGDDG